MSNVHVGGGHSKFFPLMASTTFLLLCPILARSLQAAKQDQLRGEGRGEKSAEGKRGREAFLLSQIHSPFSLLSLPDIWHLFSLTGLSYQDSTIFADCSLALS